MDTRIINLWQENEWLKKALEAWDPKRELKNIDNAQGANRRFQLLKPRIRSLMVQVDAMLSRLDALGQQNVVTKEDLRKLREVRDELTAARAMGLELKAEADAE